MQTAKIIGAGVFALFAMGSLFSALGQGGSGAYLAGRIAGALLFAALAFALWRSGTKRTPPR